jgi:hypothetical protein
MKSLENCNNVHEFIEIIKINLEMQRDSTEERCKKEKISGYDSLSKKIMIDEYGIDMESIEKEPLDVCQRHLIMALAQVLYAEKIIINIEKTITKEDCKLIKNYFFDLLLHMNGISFLNGFYSGQKNSNLKDIIIKDFSKRATDERYGNSRKLIKELGKKAEELWRAGSKDSHSKMKDYLLNEYADENKKLFFLELSEKQALKKLKEVALAMGRPDLILGRKKSS